MQYTLRQELLAGCPPQLTEDALSDELEEAEEEQEDEEEEK